MGDWFSPPEIARARKIRVAKVIYWITTSQLRAVNMASKPGGRPRWRVSAFDLQAFDEARSNRAVTPQPGDGIRKRKRSVGDVIEFFK